MLTRPDSVVHFPGEIPIEELTQGFARIVRRSAKIRPEVEADLDDRKALRKVSRKESRPLLGRRRVFQLPKRPVPNEL